MLDFLTSTAILISQSETVEDGIAKKTDDTSIEFPTKRLNASSNTLRKFSCNVEEITKEYSVFWSTPCLCVKTGDIISLFGQRYSVVRSMVIQDENGCDYAQKILTFKLR